MMLQLFPNVETVHIHWGYDWQYSTKWPQPATQTTIPSVKKLDVVVRQLTGLWMTELTTLTQQFPCPELAELQWRCPIKFETGAGQLGMFAENLKGQIETMNWKKLEKVALDVEVDVFELQEGGDMVVRTLSTQFPSAPTD
jgi:hypothetical protein